MPSALTTEEKRQLMLLKFRPVCICNTIRYPRVKEAMDPRGILNPGRIYAGL